MPRSPGEGFRTGAFRTAAAFAILLLAAVAATSLLPVDPSFAASQETPPAATSGGNSSGEDSTPTSTSDANPQKPRGEDTSVRNPATGRDVILSISLLFFAVIFMITILIGFGKHIREKSGEIERIGIVTVLVVGALYLVTSGFGTTNVAPAFALFGTVAGYILGQVRPRKHRSDRAREVKPTDEKDA